MGLLHISDAPIIILIVFSTLKEQKNNYFYYLKSTRNICQHKDHIGLVTHKSIQSPKHPEKYSVKHGGIIIESLELFTIWR